MVLRVCSSFGVWGGRTIAQDESTSVVWGMPRAAVELGAADQILPLPLIGRAIAGHLSVQNPSQAQARPDHSEKIMELGATGPSRWAGLPCSLARSSSG